MYVEQYVVKGICDKIFPYLCIAKRNNYFNDPIVHQVWDWNNPDDIVKHDIPLDELCQCCETKLAIMVNGGKIKRDNLGNILIDIDGNKVLT